MRTLVKVSQILKTQIKDRERYEIVSNCWGKSVDGVNEESHGKTNHYVCRRCTGHFYCYDNKLVIKTMIDIRSIHETLCG